MVVQEYLLSPDLCSDSLHNQQGQSHPSGDFRRSFQRESLRSAEQRQRERSEDEQDPAVQSLRGPQREPIQPEAMLRLFEK